MVPSLSGDQECIVCFKDFTLDNPRIQKNICHANLHESCLKEWLAQAPNLDCPSCRQPVNIDPADLSVGPSLPATPARTQQTAARIFGSDGLSGPRGEDPPCCTCS